MSKNSLVVLPGMSLLVKPRDGSLACLAHTKWQIWDQHLSARLQISKYYIKRIEIASLKGSTWFAFRCWEPLCMCVCATGYSPLVTLVAPPQDTKGKTYLQLITLSRCHEFSQSQGLLSTYWL